MNQDDKPELKLGLISRRAWWCGTVFALALLVSLLNVFPPQSIHYRVEAEVVLSHSRLQELEQVLTAGEAMAAPSAGPVLRRIDVLDQMPWDAPPAPASGLNGAVDSESNGSAVGPAGIRATADGAVLAKLTAIWPERCSNADCLAWIRRITGNSDSAVFESEAGRTARFAQWELAAAEHYAARHDFLRSPASTQPSQQAESSPAATTDGRTFTLASSRGNPTISTSSYVKPVPESAPAAEQEMRDELDAMVESASDRFQASQVAYQRVQDSTAGPVHLAGAPHLKAEPESMPTWLVGSVLVLGLASGAIAGWVHCRIQSGGGFEPQAVAHQLELEGLPIAGVKALSISALDESGWIAATGDRARAIGRGTTRNLILLSESVVFVWVSCLAIRFVTDAYWRQLLIDNPLAGLSRIFSGLP